MLSEAMKQKLVDKVRGKMASAKPDAVEIDVEPMEGDETSGGTDAAEDTAVDAMISAMGGVDVDREAFKSGLKDFVRACMKADEGGEYE